MATYTFDQDNPVFKPIDFYDEDFDSIQPDDSGTVSSRRNSRSSVDTDFTKISLGSKGSKVVSKNRLPVHNGDNTSISSDPEEKAPEKYTTTFMQNGGIGDDGHQRLGNTTSNRSAKNMITKKNKKGNKCKALLSLFVIVAALGGIVGIIVWYNQERGFISASQPLEQLPGGCTSELVLKFNDTPRITCTIHEIDIRRTVMFRIAFEPEAFSLLYTEDSYNFTLEGDEDEVAVGPWMFRFLPNTELTVMTMVITREPARCGLSGVYTLDYIDNHGQIVRQEKTKISVKSEMSDVTLSMKESASNEADGNKTYYLLTCSAKSDCHPAPIELLGVVDGQVVPLYTVAFSCKIDYDFDEGWSISCTATIPDDMRLQLGKIICRPQHGNETVADEKQATVSTQVLCDDNNEDNRCNFGCPVGIEDNYFPNLRQCDRYHRCVNNILYTSPCADGTYFDEDACACNHINMVLQCDENGYRPMPADISKGCEDVN